MAEAPPTILQIIPQLETGGAELSTIEIAEAVTRAGGRAIVLSEGGRLLDRLAEAGGEFMAFPAKTKNPATILLNAQRIASIARRENVSLIHARSRAPAWSALIAARKLGLPFVTTYHGAYNEKSKLKNWYNGVMARADVVIANSRYTADLVQSRYGTPSSKLRVIYRGVDLRRFDPTAVSAERIAALKAKWGASERTRVVLQAARLTHWKGQGHLVSLAARMREKFPDVLFVFAGDDQGRSGYRAELDQKIAAQGLGNAVRLVGHEDDIPAAFAAAHVAFVGSIEPEAFGRAAAEAQAMGCPVISTNIGAPPETVLAPPRVTADQRTGWLVTPGDLDEYEAALSEALSLDDAQRAAIAARARQHVVANFTTANMQRQTLGVYAELLDTQSARFFRGDTGP